MNTLQTEFKEKLKEISRLSDKINKHDKNKLLHLIKEHIQEIEELYKKNNEHWTIETADLIKDIDEVFNKCLPRYDIKLKRLAENVS